MSDLDERFRELREKPAPDQWQDIQRRDPQPAQAHGRSRLLAAGVALLVAAAAFVILARAFVPFTGTTAPADQTSSTSPSSPTLSEAPVVFLAPYLNGGTGWSTYSSPPVKEGDASYAWASTIPIVQADVQYGAAIPPSTIEHLPANGIVVTVEVVPSEYQSSSVPFPYADRSYNLGSATVRGPEAEEPEGNYSVYEIGDGEAATLVRVYFGASSPGQDLIDRAQQELDTLQLPPACSAPAEGGYDISETADSGSPGDSISITGRVPFQREDGSFDTTGEGQMIAWWNVRSSDWPYLSSYSTTEPSPAVPGQPITRLGEAAMVTCTFSIRFVVPAVPPGDYPIVVLQGTRDSATLEGSMVLQVTPAR
jgi:hypothetical protein